MAVTQAGEARDFMDAVENRQPPGKSRMFGALLGLMIVGVIVKIVTDKVSARNKRRYVLYAPSNFQIVIQLGLIIQLHREQAPTMAMTDAEQGRRFMHVVANEQPAGKASNKLYFQGLCYE
jgi:hypothetical protein